MDPITAYKTLLSGHTFRLLHKNELGLLTGFASCFLWQRSINEDPIIVTAGHRLKLSGAMLETTFIDSDGRPLLLDAGTFNIFYSDDIDFAFSRFPKKVIKYLQDNPQVEISCYTGEIEEPNIDEDYGFCKWNNYEFVKSGEELYLHQYECSEIGMKYIRKENGFYLFKTLQPLKEDEYYAGASGSPITDREGRIVSILVGRTEDKSFLKGASLEYLIKKIEELT